MDEVDMNPAGEMAEAAKAWTVYCPMCGVAAGKLCKAVKNGHTLPEGHTHRRRMQATDDRKNNRK